MCNKIGCPDPDGIFTPRPPSTHLSDQERSDIAELVKYLRAIPSRHRHVLAMVDSRLYQGLISLETDAKTFADEVEKAIVGS